jgi:hypothetical protein
VGLWGCGVLFFSLKFREDIVVVSLILRRCPVMLCVAPSKVQLPEECPPIRCFISYIVQMTFFS